MLRGRICSTNEEEEGLGLKKLVKVFWNGNAKRCGTIIFNKKVCDVWKKLTCSDIPQGMEFKYNQANGDGSLPHCWPVLRLHFVLLMFQKLATHETVAYQHRWQLGPLPDCQRSRFSISGAFLYHAILLFHNFSDRYNLSSTPRFILISFPNLFFSPFLSTLFFQTIFCKPPFLTNEMA